MIGPKPSTFDKNSLRASYATTTYYFGDGIVKGLEVVAAGDPCWYPAVVLGAAVGGHKGFKGGLIGILEYDRTDYSIERLSKVEQPLFIEKVGAAAGGSIALGALSLGVSYGVQQAGQFAAEFYEKLSNLPIF